MPVYLVYLLVGFGLPVAVAGWIARRRLWRYRRTVLWSLVFVAGLGGVWDWLACVTGVWRYDTAPTLGVWLGPLPVEEFLGFYTLGTLWIVTVVLWLLGRGNDV